jgi:FlaA1/EpsC-like NDP-sugar epimerase
MSIQILSEAIPRMKDSILSSFFFVLRKSQKESWAGMILKYRAWFIFICQAVLIFSSLLMAWLLRFNFHLPDPALLLSVAPVLIAIRLCAIARCGLMGGWWRYTDIDDAVAIAKSIATGSLAFVLCMRVVLGITAFPRALYVLEPLLSMLLLAGVRVFSRIIAESFQEQTTARAKVILIGAGAGAERTLREIARPGSDYYAIACVDDDGSKTGGKIHGVPILGTIDELPALVAKHAIKEILIAVPSATGSQMQRFVEVCTRANVRFKTVPSLHEILSGQIDAAQFREVRVEDLLGRDPVEIDLKSVREQVAGQTVLVTGAAGTIGSELCRQVLQARPRKLLCLDHNENGIFYLQMELTKQNKGTQLIFCVTDFGDNGRMGSLLDEHRPDMIFHAAAYKHVPMMEMNVYEAVKNNIFAVLEFLGLAEKSGCAAFVLISSDKAVKPTNIMGATKRVGELIISCRPARSMRCVSVRFGNVLGSNGSVVPILQKQLRDRQQLTITHPEVTRFFMTTREAVSLVLQAFAIGNHGDTLVLDMGKPVRIVELARALIRLSGRSEQEVGIRFTGLRDGEKLFEELSYPSEEIHSTSSPQIRQVRGAPHRWFDLERHLDQLRASMFTKGSAGIREKMKEIVPEYSSFTNDPLEGNTVRMNPEVAVRTTVLFPGAAVR